MIIEICNSEEDQYGNSKENIFIALGEHGEYLGSAFTYPAINCHQTPDTPYLIYISINSAGHLDESLNKKLASGYLTQCLPELKRCGRSIRN